MLNSHTKEERKSERWHCIKSWSLMFVEKVLELAMHS